MTTFFLDVYKRQEQIGSGAEKLADGSETVGTGLSVLQDGSRTLKSKLSDGAAQAGKVKDSKKTVGMFASPVKTEHSQMSDVQNNGHAMAPYMMSVALYVACIAFCLMFPLKEHNGLSLIHIYMGTFTNILRRGLS